MCLLSLPYPTTFNEKLLLVVEAFNCFGSGVAGLSDLTHTHTPPRLTSQWKKNHYDHSRRHSFSPCLCWTLTHFQFTSSLWVVHPHAGTILRPLSSRTGIILCWTHTASWELCVFIHNLLCCGGLPYILGRESAHFMHSLEVGIFLFLSVVYVCFSLPIRGLYISLPLPSCECGFPFHPRTV